MKTDEKKSNLNSLNLCFWFKWLAFSSWGTKFFLKERVFKKYLPRYCTMLKNAKYVLEHFLSFSLASTLSGLYSPNLQALRLQISQAPNLSGSQLPRLPSLCAYRLLAPKLTGFKAHRLTMQVKKLSGCKAPKLLLVY